MNALSARISYNCQYNDASTITFEKKKKKNIKITTSSHLCFIFSLFQNDLLSLIFFPRVIHTKSHNRTIMALVHTYRNNQDDQVVYLTQLKLCNNVLLSRRKQEKFGKHPEFRSAFLEFLYYLTSRLREGYV